MNLNSKRKQQSIRSYLRIKPVNSNQQKIIEFTNPNSIVVKGQSQEEYTFNKIFNENSTNSDLFETIGGPLIQHSLEGFNSCVLAYGQTSSGKTYTMKGQTNCEGLIPLTVQKLFSNIKNKNMVAEITISYFQIYNQNIIDLLSSSDVYLDIREDYKKNITIIGLNEVTVSSVDQVMNLLYNIPQFSQEGESRRKFASNNLNMSSSRSHTIFKISISVVHEDFSKSLSVINMVDLAGSEGVAKTKTDGSTRKQGENINKSILALGKVIRNMSDKISYVGFRDSKLTRILQSSLCSNSKSIVICTINPTLSNVQQTINTIKFGVEASNIKLSLKQNINLSNQKPKSNEDIQFTDNMGLLANERVEYQQNKRTITHLRQQNMELRDVKRKLEEKVEFLELQIHKYQGIIQHNEDEIQRYQKLSFKRDINIQERQLYERKIDELKSQMNVMADKYEFLNEINAKVQKNQRYLLDRIAKYQNQIDQLKHETKEELAKKPKTPMKLRNTNYPPKEQQQCCPLTIGSIVLLKTQIIRLKQEICCCHDDIARLIEDRNQLANKIEILQRADDQERNITGKINPSHFEQKQIKYLLRKIKKLKDQITFGKNRQKKLIKLLKDYSKRGIKDFDEFNEWFAIKHQPNTPKKQNCFSSPLNHL